MVTLSNISLIALGINQVREGNAIVEGGIATIAEGIFAAWNTPVRWSYGSGDDEVSGAVNVGDMFKGRRHPDGKVDSKFLPAMYRAIAECYGVEGEFSSADKMAFQRGFAVAAAKVAGVAVEFVDAKVERKGKSVKVRAVQVPASVALKLTDGDKATDLGEKVVSAIQSNAKLFGKGALPEAEALERAAALPVQCVGGKNDILGKLPSSTDIANTLREHAVAGGFMAPPKARAASASGDKFVEALAYVDKCLDLFLNLSPLDGAPFAPSDALESSMRKVAKRIDAYFSA